MCARYPVFSQEVSPFDNYFVFEDFYYQTFTLVREGHAVGISGEGDRRTVYHDKLFLEDGRGKFQLPANVTMEKEHLWEFINFSQVIRLDNKVRAVLSKPKSD